MSLKPPRHLFLVGGCVSPSLHAIGKISSSSTHRQGTVKLYISNYLKHDSARNVKVTLPNFYRTSDRVCARISTCNEGVEFELKPPTYLSDRKCAHLTECSPSEYEDRPPSSNQGNRDTSSSFLCFIIKIKKLHE